jgi:RimJ/RimL family protein N-acetyltransferase
MYTPGKPPILHDLPQEVLGDRVLLRPYRAGDGEAVWSAVEESRELLRPWMPWVDHHRTPADSEAFVRRMHARWILREDLVVGIWLRETGEYVGSSGLHPIDWDVPSFEVGYWLRASAQGRGYATETTRVLIGLAFETLGAHRLFLRCDERNERSAAVARRLGFTPEGTRRLDSRSPSGELRNTLVFSMIPEEFAAQEHAGDRL